MTYFIIKTHYIPTESTKASDSKACEHDWYTGKKGFNLNTKSAHDRKDNKLWDCEYALENAYTRFSDAKRSLKTHKENNAWETKHGHWIVDSEIITVER